jgi:hypothetical protein
MEIKTKHYIKSRDTYHKSVFSEILKKYYFLNIEHNNKSSQNWFFKDVIIC